MKAVIIDDEKKSRQLLSNYLKRYCPEVELIGEGDNVKSGIKIIEELNPELVFLDVEMPDGTGFDLLKNYKGNKDRFCVIFVTAFSQYAIKAFQFSAIDYLTKPVDPSYLTQAVEKAAKELDQDDFSKKLETLISNNNGFEKIVLPTSDGIQLVRIEDIVRCESDGNYTTFYFKNNTSILISRTLKEYTNLLTESGFYRIHHSHLINMNYIDKYINRDGGYIIMEDGSEVQISRRKKEDFLAVLYK